jgi:hypothetical protein
MLKNSSNTCTGLIFYCLTLIFIYVHIYILVQIWQSIYLIWVSPLLALTLHIPTLISTVYPKVLITIFVQALLDSCPANNSMKKNSLSTDLGFLKNVLKNSRNNRFYFFCPTRIFVHCHLHPYMHSCTN